MHKHQVPHHNIAQHREDPRVDATEISEQSIRSDLIIGDTGYWTYFEDVLSLELRKAFPADLILIECQKPMAQAFVSPRDDFLYNLQYFPNISSSHNRAVRSDYLFVQEHLLFDEEAVSQ